jgi:hypothetical protein
VLEVTCIGRQKWQLKCGPLGFANCYFYFCLRNSCEAYKIIETDFLMIAHGSGSRMVGGWSNVELAEAVVSCVVEVSLN